VQGPLVSNRHTLLQLRQFLQETIESVLAQDYPKFEYLVMDGGSTMDAGDLERYAGACSYVSEPDGGAAERHQSRLPAVAGGILAWLGADDLYLPGAIASAVEAFAAAPGAAVVYGEGRWIDESGKLLGRYPTVSPYTPEMFRRECGVCQPLFPAAGGGGAGGAAGRVAGVGFDYELVDPALARHEFRAIPRELACSRMHRRNKSLGQKAPDV